MLENLDDILLTLNNPHWDADFSHSEKTQAIQALEEGKIIYFPNLNYALNEKENSLLTPKILQGKSKNICYNPVTNRLKWVAKDPKPAQYLLEMMQRFMSVSYGLIHSLIPHYESSLQLGRTSYRPIEIAGRKSSIRKDDTRLHVDAFPATPNQGKRILRVFSNINPNGQTRIWQTGEPFENVVQKFHSNFSMPFPGMNFLLSLLNITKSKRSLYDHIMLQLHDLMKMTDAYQNSVIKTDVAFPSGSTWIVMTDSVSHAALSGQFLLEQTFYLPWNKMYNPELSPFRILERILDKKLK